MILSSIIITVIYAVLIIAFIVGFNRVQNFEFTKYESQNKFSILIPFRNEVKTIPTLLESFTKLNYPFELFEIILINDNSSDNFKNLIDNFQNQNKELQIHLIDSKRKSNSPKKDAIKTAINKANFDWIITTDADCIVPENWLYNFDGFIQKNNTKMIVAPVAFIFEDNFINNFQILDFLSLQGSTLGGFGIDKPFLCNGANLCYNKQAFLKVNGFDGNDHIAGGDDIFLLEKFISIFPNTVHYLKSETSIVKTKAQSTLNQLIDQRVRWAAKTSSYKNSFAKLVGFIVLITNFYLIFLFVFATLNYISWQHFGIVFLVKFNIDFLLIYKTSKFFNQQEALKKYLTSSLLYPIFNVFIAFLSFFKNFEWKERTFKK
ncbi:MAG: glycosyltransferase [Bacteroidota bacterium]